MRKVSIVAAAIGSLFVASSSFAAFTFSSTSAATANGNLRVDIFALNDGSAIGAAVPAGTTKVQGVEIVTAAAGPGTTFKFRFAGGGVDLFNSKGAPIDVLGDGSLIVPNNNSTIYLAESAGDNTYQGLSPASTSSTWASLSNFSVSYAATGATAPAANTGAGARIASLVISPGGSFTLAGNIGAEQGTKVPFSFSFGTVVTNTPPVITGNSGADVVFGTIVTTPLPFSGTVTLSDLDSADVLDLVLGTLPANVSGVTVTPSGTNPKTFTIAGTIAYVGNGVTAIPFTTSDGSSDSNPDPTGVFNITVTPEPASLSLIGLSGLLMGRRRK